MWQSVMRKGTMAGLPNNLALSTVRTSAEK